MDARTFSNTVPNSTIEDTPSKDSLFFIGVDLGQMQDYTAIAIVERMEYVTNTGDDDGEHIIEHRVRHLERFPLGTLYPEVVRKVGIMMNAPELEDRTILVVDATGVGRAVVDMFTNAYLRPVAVTITGGNKVSNEGWDFGVPKRDLIGVLEVAMQTGRLKIAKELPEAKTLMDEMLNFKRKITLTGNDTYEAWREGQHDDLVLATALAVWYAEQYVRPRIVSLW